MLKLNQTLGYYTPAYFKIYIRSIDEIDLNKLNQTQLTTFVHEYTHFIQDFTTIKGLQNIYNTFERLRLYLTETYKNRKVDIPATFNHEILSMNQWISNKTWGSRFALNNVATLNNIRRDKVDLDKTILTRYPELNSFSIIKATACIPNGNNCEIEIGTLAIMESMAHLAEGLMNLPVTQSPDYPYNIVKLMSNTLCKRVNLDDETLYALCDVALQCTTPGVAMYEMLKGIENGSYNVPQDGDDVYKIFPKTFDEWSNTANDSIVNSAIEHLSSLIQGPMGKAYQAWINNMMSYAINMRRNRPDFLISEIRKHNRYIDIVNLVGTPLMVNSEEEYSKVPVVFPYKFPVEMDVEFFRAIDYIMGLFETGERKCALIKWCKQSGIKTDINCIVNPPKRSDPKEYAELCPVSGIWKHWNLSQYKFKKQCLFRPICK